MTLCFLDVALICIETNKLIENLINLIYIYSTHGLNGLTIERKRKRVGQSMSHLIGIFVLQGWCWPCFSPFIFWNIRPEGKVWSLKTNKLLKVNVLKSDQHKRWTRNLGSSDWSCKKNVNFLSFQWKYFKLLCMYLINIWLVLNLGFVFVYSTGTAIYVC